MEELENFFILGPGYGGSCFPKDTLALVKTAKDSKVQLGLVEHVVNSNNVKKKNMYKRVLSAVESKNNFSSRFNFLNPTLMIWRDSPSLNIIPDLIKNNCFLKVFDLKV